jgi:hypothetical protein
LCSYDMQYPATAAQIFGFWLDIPFYLLTFLHVLHVLTFYVSVHIYFKYISLFINILCA